MGQTQGELDLQEEVANILPGTVNMTRGTAMYNSPDQPFSFQKYVQFGDRPNWPDLKLNNDLGEWIPLPSNMPHSSTPYCTSIPHANPLNRTFDVSGISPLVSNPQKTATIVAEVSTAAAAQASKEFRCMWEPKITKFKGGYWADAELIF